LTLSACAAVVGMAAVFYFDIKSDGREREARVRAIETRQAVADATRVDIERRLGSIETDLKAMNGKLDQLLRRGVDAK